MSKRVIRLSPDVLLSIVKFGTRPSECIKGVPDDAQVVDIDCDFFHKTFNIIVESSQWPDGQDMDDFSPVFRTIYEHEGEEYGE